jgi:DNA-binding transcriptional LysR family regulator
MQPLNWQDLRYVLALGRGRTLASAARLLGVDDTTVARRLAVIQNALGTRLYQRLADGTLQLTAPGERVALSAERTEREIGQLAATLSGVDDAVAGTVRVTSVPIIVNRLLVPAAPPLLKQYPALLLELNSDARDVSLTRREADLAVRLARPQTGGTKLTTRRIGRLHYGIYASVACSRREAATMPWITYDEAMAHLPQARWIATTTGGDQKKIAALRASDAETVLSAVGSGLGRSLLPRIIADADARLRRLDPPRSTPAVSRELWLIAHSELRTLGRIEAVVRWIEQVLPR